MAIPTRVVAVGNKPRLVLHGTEENGKVISIVEDTGVVQVYDESAEAVITTLDKLRQVVSMVRIPECGAASDTWERAVLYAWQDLEVVEAGIVPDEGFGQGSDYATLSVVNLSLIHI